MIPQGESLIVQIDCGGTLLAEITPRACRDLELREGLDIYCLIKTHSISYLSELDASGHQRTVVNHGGGYYYFDATSPKNSIPLPGLM